MWHGHGERTGCRPSSGGATHRPSASSGAHGLLDMRARTHAPDGISSAYDFLFKLMS